VHTKLGVFLVFLLATIIIAPAYANVTSVSLEKSFYTNEEKMTFVGKAAQGDKSVYVIIRDPFGAYKGMVADPIAENNGTYSTNPQDVDNFFDTKGAYNATAFTDSQGEKNGITIKLQYDGNKVSILPTFVLALNSISDKTIEEEKTLVLTATLTEPTTDAIFSLENKPIGAYINSQSGQFIWTPTKDQGPSSYVFDIVVKKGALEDRENIKVTVTEPVPVIQPKPTPESEPITEPEPIQELGIASFVDPTKDPQSYVDRYNNEPTYKKWFDENYPEYSSIYEAVGLEEPKGLASFVDPTKDPQSYVDRYNNEPTYKKWFDENYPEYSSIYEAVGLEEPKGLASFVDPTLDPQFYIDRYNNEPKFKIWFDENFPDMTIYDAVGLEKPEIKEQEMGQCGPGTILVDGVCTPDENQQGGGCLIATAAYGSEMAPQVQQLRELRDNSLLQTASGTSFINTFNDFYYSFSPTVADWERENPAFKEFVKISLTPLISSLSILNYVDMDSEESVLGYGISLILLNVGMYFVAPAMLFFSIKKAKTRLSF